MIDEINLGLKNYYEEWQSLVVARNDADFFKKLTPTAVAWKTTDLKDFDKRFAALRSVCDQIHLAWLNGRWLATMHLKETKLTGNITIIKLMQRRPGSTDSVGLDHLDFLLPVGANAKTAVKAEPDLKWSEEKNGDNCKWLSIWFNGTEAKLRSDTVLDVCIAELQEINNHLTLD